MGYLQKATGACLAGSSATATLNGVTAGSLLVVQLAYEYPSGGGGQAGPTAPTGYSVGVADNTVTYGTLGVGCALYYKSNATAGTNTVTISLPSGTYASMTLSEFSGYAGPHDKTASASGTTVNTTTWATGSTATTSTANQLVMAQCAGDEASGSSNIHLTSPASPGYTSLSLIVDTNANVQLEHSYKEVTSTGTQSATWTKDSYSSNQGWAASVVTFPASAGAPPTITVQPVDNSGAVGGSAAFSVTATGTGSLTYQWQSSANAATWSNISLATSSTYTKLSLAAGDNGLYIRVAVTDSNGTTNSIAVQLFVSGIVTGKGRGQANSWAFINRRKGRSSSLLDRWTTSAIDEDKAEGTVWGNWFNLTTAVTISGVGANTTAAFTQVATGTVASGGTITGTGANTTDAFTQVSAGTVSVSGTGANTTTQTQVSAGTVSLSGTGANTTTQTQASAGTVLVAGAGANTTTQTQVSAGTVSLSGTGANTTTQTQVSAGTVSLSGAGTNTVTDFTQVSAGTVSGGTVFSVSVAESAAAVEAVSTWAAAPVLGDVAAYGNIVFGDVSYAGNAAVPFSVDIAESAAVSDAATAQMIVTAAQAETASATDASSAAIILNSAQSESAAVSDAATTVLLATGTQAETVAVSDTESAVLVAAATQAESAAVSDSSIAGLLLASTQAESVGATDSSTTTATVLAAQAESAGATDTVTSTLSLTAAQSESAAATDTVVSVLTVAAQQTESASVSDTQAAATVVAAAQAESSAVADSSISGLLFVAAQAESVAASDTSAAGLLLLSTQSESASATDLLNYTVNTSAFVTGVPVTVSIGVPLVWGQVNDSQTPSWTQVQDNQTPAWVQVQDNQAPSWTDVTAVLAINDVATFGGLVFGDVSYAGNLKQSWLPGTETWAQVQDNQSPDWQEVVT